MAQFFTLLTEIGRAKQANAIALQQPIEITQLAVGDGGGSLPEPQGDEEQLINEVRRAAINTSHVDEDNPTWIVVEQVIPPDVGGWTIREVGIFDSAGDLIAYGNYPETYKPVLEEGSSRTQTVRFVLEVSDTAAVTLKVDPSVVLATREYVDTQRTEHEASRDHPAATELAQGMIQRATSPQALAGSDNARAMTPARVHEAFKQFGLGVSGPAIADLDSAAEIEALGSGLYSAQGGTAGRPTSGGGTVLISKHSNKFFSISYRYISTGDEVRVLERNLADGAFSEWREVYHSGNLGAALDDRIADQPTVDAGTDDSKLITPKKLNAWVKQASESVMGLFKVSTQPQVDSGIDDTTAVTPKKLRWGVSLSIGSGGYLALPSWLGGSIFQWGSATTSGSGDVTVNLPIEYPGDIFGVAATLFRGAGTVPEFTVVGSRATTSFTLGGYDAAGARTVQNVFWLSMGH